MPLIKPFPPIIALQSACSKQNTAQSYGHNKYESVSRMLHPLQVVASTTAPTFGKIAQLHIEDTDKLVMILYPIDKN